MMVVPLAVIVFAPTTSSFAALVVTKPLSATLLFPLAPGETSSGFDTSTPLLIQNAHFGFGRTFD